MTTPYEKIADSFVEADRELDGLPIRQEAQRRRPEPTPGRVPVPPSPSPSPSGATPVASEQRVPVARPRPVGPLGGTPGMGPFMRRLADLEAAEQEAGAFLDADRVKQILGHISRGLLGSRDPRDIPGKTLDRLEWYERNVVEPVAAPANIVETPSLLGLAGVPGFSDEFGFHPEQFPTQEGYREAYRRNIPLGTRIASEVFLDPANLIPGVGFTKVPRSVGPAIEAGVRAAGRAAESATQTLGQRLGPLAGEAGFVRLPGSKVSEELATTINSRIAVLEGALAKPGRLPQGMGTRKEALAELGRAKAQSFQAELIQGLDNMDEVLETARAELDKATDELTARNRPFHAGLKASYPEVKVAQLDGYATELDDFVRELEGSRTANQGAGDPNIPAITLAEEVAEEGTGIPLQGAVNPLQANEPFIQAANAVELITILESHKLPNGGLLRGLEAYQRVITELSVPDLGQLLQWVRSQNAFINRFLGSNIDAEFRARGLATPGAVAEVAPRTSVQSGFGIGEAPQQMGLDIGGRGAQLAPLIPPEQVAAQGERARLLREGQQGLDFDAAEAVRVGQDFATTDPEAAARVVRMTAEELEIGIQNTKRLIVERRARGIDVSGNERALPFMEERLALLKQQGLPEEAVVPEYRNPHQPKPDGPRAHNLIEGGLVPDDIYEHPEFYMGDSQSASGRATRRAILSMRDKPDKTVTVYRAAPTNELNDGDWVTFSRKYAEGHGMDPTDPARDFPVHSFQVKARDVRWAADSLEEFGYFPSRGTTLYQYDELTAEGVRAIPEVPEGLPTSAAPQAATGPETIRAFHGTFNEPFTAFDAARFGSETDDGLLGAGVYLSTDPAVGATRPTRITADVQLTNPLRLTIGDSLGSKNAVINEALGTEALTGKPLTDVMQSRGYDGVILDYSTAGYQGREIVVFSPEQVSIVGNASRTSGAPIQSPTTTVSVAGVDRPELAQQVAEGLPAGAAAPETALNISDVDVVDAVRGESFGTKTIRDANGNTLISADISLLPDEVHIQMIETRQGNRRQGLATRLVDDLFREFPDRKITISGATDEGKAFFGRRYSIADDGEIVPRLAAPETAIAPAGAPEAPLAGAAPPVDPPSVLPVATAAPIPPENRAVERVFNRISLKEPKASVRDRLSSGWTRFKTEMLDDLDPLKGFTNVARRTAGDIATEKDPYIAGRLIRGNTGKADVFLEQGTFGKEFYLQEGRIARPNFRGPGLAQILQPVKEPTAMRDFIAYITSRRAVGLTARKIKTGIPEADAAEAIRTLEAQYPNFPEVAKAVYKYQDDLLVYGEEMGLLDPGLVQRLRTQADYVPFHRVMEELESSGFGRGLGKKLANVTSPIKRIKGSERPIVNPLESIVKNTYMMISAADRNQVGVLMAELAQNSPELQALFKKIPTPMTRVAQVTAKELGISIEGLGNADVEKIFDVFRPSFRNQDNVVTVLVKGQRQYYEVDPDLYRSMLALNRSEMNMVLKVMAFPARTLRAGAILSPDFMIRNPVRDQFAAMAYSNYGFIPGVDFLKGIGEVLGKSDDYLLYKMSGAEHSMLVSVDREYLKKSFDQVLRGKGPVDYVKNPLEGLQVLSELSEKGTRMGEFARGIRSGASPTEAGFAARDLMDYNKMGTAARVLNQVIPFFNAAIRGSDKMITSFKTNPVRTTAKVTAAITIPSLLLYAWNRNNPRWEEIPQWQKDLFWIFIPPGDDSTIIRIPKPFELGILFGSVPERMWEYWDTKDRSILDEVFGSVRAAASPGFMPQAILPFIENVANHSFFLDRPIVSRSREDFPPELQFGGRTSETSKVIARAFRVLGPWADWSPAKIDNVIRAWGGGLGGYATSAIDKLLAGTGIVNQPPDPEGTLADVPVVKAFVVRDVYGSGSASLDRFYEELDKLQEHEKFLKEMFRLGEEKKFEDYKGKHPEALLFYDWERKDHYSASARYFRRVAREISKVRKGQRLVFESRTMDPKEKRRRIDQSNRDITVLARAALDEYAIGTEEKPPLVPVQDTQRTPAPATPTPPVQPAAAPTSTPGAPSSRWEDVAPMIGPDLVRTWSNGQTLTPEQVTRMRQVHAAHPMGEPNFDTWLQGALRREAEDYMKRQSQRLPEPTPQAPREVVGAGR